MAADLLPCPFCGSAPETMTLAKAEFWEGPEYVIHCANEDCHCQPSRILHTGSASDAGWNLVIKAWNTRGGKLGCEQPAEVAARLEWLDETQAAIFYHCKEMEKLKARFDLGFE